MRHGSASNHDSAVVCSDSTHTTRRRSEPPVNERLTRKRGVRRPPGFGQSAFQAAALGVAKPRPSQSLQEQAGGPHREEPAWSRPGRVVRNRPVKAFRNEKTRAVSSPRPAPAAGRDVATAAAVSAPRCPTPARPARQATRTITQWMVGSLSFSSRRLAHARPAATPRLRP